MNSANALSDSSSKISGLVLNVLSSLNASLGNNGAAQSLFANLLSQTDLPAPPPDPTPAAPPQAASNAQPSQQTPPGGTTDNTNNTADADATQGQTPQAQTAGATSDWTLLKKFLRHEAAIKRDADKNASHNATDDQSAQSPATVGANTANQNPNGQAAANATAPSAAAPAANDPNDPNASAGGTPAPDAAALLSAAAATPNAAPPTDPAAPATNTADTSGGAGKNADTSGGDGISDAELVMLLMQLERLAAGQLANAAAANGGADPANTSGSGQSTGANTASATTGSSPDSQDKIDLKGLLATLAELNAGGSDDGTPSGQTGDAGADDSQNAASAFPALAASLQNAAPPSPSTSSSAGGNDKWMNADFLNLFNVANNNANPAAASPVFTPAVNPGLSLAGGDGAALDADAQSQNGANLRNTADGASTATNNTSPLAAGTQQAASPYDFASQLSALRATKGGPTGLPTAVEQVVLQMSRGISKDGSSQMTIQLRPAELGRVDVKLNVGSDGKVQGTVTADNPATLGLLLKDVRGLERALQEAGLRADPGSLQFNLRGDGQAGGGFGQNADNSSAYPNNAGGTANATTALSAFADTAETYYLTPGGVNMRV